MKKYDKSDVITVLVFFGLVALTIWAISSTIQTENTMKTSELENIQISEFDKERVTGTVIASVRRSKHSRYSIIELNDGRFYLKDENYKVGKTMTFKTKKSTVITGDYKNASNMWGIRLKQKRANTAIENVKNGATTAKSIHDNKWDLSSEFYEMKMKK